MIGRKLSANCIKQTLLIKKSLKKSTMVSISKSQDNYSTPLMNAPKQTNISSNNSQNKNTKVFSLHIEKINLFPQKIVSLPNFRERKVVKMVHPTKKSKNDKKRLGLRLSLQKKDERLPNPISSLIYNLISNLTKTNIIPQKASKFYSINSQDLKFLVEQLIIGGIQPKKIEKIEDRFYSLADSIHQITSFVRRQHLLRKITKNKLEKQLYSQRYHNLLSKQDKICYKVLSNQISKSTQILSQIQQKIINQEKWLQIMKQKQKLSQKTYNQLQNLIQVSSKDLKNILKNIQEKRKQQSKVIQQSKIYHNYVYQQNDNKLIKMAGIAYQEIEADIYDYASMLQCNRLASELDYEPLSVQFVTADLAENLKQLNWSIIHNASLDIATKQKMMRDFVLEISNKYEKRDEGLKKLINFKTLTIRNFIEKMKHWLDNWTLKQEYLVNLRNEFVLDAQILKEKIAKIAVIHPNSKQFSVQILQSFEKLQNNYKMGNSFY